VRPAAQQCQTPIETGQQCRGWQDSRARGGELDRQRQPVETPADLDDSFYVGVGHLEFGHDGPRPLREQRHRRTDGAPGLPHRRKGQRHHRPEPFTGEAQRRPARRQDTQARTVDQEVGHQRRHRQDVLEVVEDQEELAAAQRHDKTVAQGT
jgi:hypothetical protein